MNKEEAQKLLLTGINLGIYLALADTVVDLEVKRDDAKAALLDAMEEGKTDDVIARLNAQKEVLDSLFNDYTDYECSSVAGSFNELTIDDCNFVYSKIKDLCVSHVQQVHDEFDYLVKQVLLGGVVK